MLSYKSCGKGNDQTMNYTIKSYVENFRIGPDNTKGDPCLFYYKLEYFIVRRF